MRRIRRLPEDVVNRIAAGEVVCRPSAALKELLENSLDAGATSISVIVRDGGMKLLQVTDDGKGIASDDLSLLCERFATSKITSYEDLEEVQTFGFRGEALASMSHVSRLTVLTKTRGSSVAYKASYLSGALRGPPQATAGVDGTTITLEEMFYNLPTRRRALKSSSDEYRLVLDVVARYAIHYPQVAFVCRRHQSGSASRLSSNSDFRTEGNSSVGANIRTGFGSGLSHETMSFEIGISKADASASAVVSTANYSAKKGTFILFVNGRLVECHPFKRAVWAVYSSFLPKNSFPFVYIALKMKQSNLDVNVHPTKKEVRFLHETVIMDAFTEELCVRLKGTETSRTFLAQTVITLDHKGDKNAINAKLGVEYDKKHDSQASQAICSGTDGADTTDHFNGITDIKAIPMADKPDSTRENLAFALDDYSVEERSEVSKVNKTNQMEIPSTKRMRQTTVRQLGLSSSTSARPSSNGGTIYPKDKIRTGSNTPVGLYDVFLTHSVERSAAIDIQSRRRRRPTAIPLLTSVEHLVVQARKACHKGLSEVLKEHLFVGVASPKYALLQHGTKLLLADIDRLLEELMYQQTLIKFADLDTFSLNPPAPVSRLLKCYLSSIPESLIEERVDAEPCAGVLIEKADMLSEYFGVRLRGESPDNLVVERLPLLFPGVIPDIKLLGRFLYHLVIETDWSSEEPCFRDISLRIAEWYGAGWATLQSHKKDQESKENAGENESLLREEAEKHSSLNSKGRNSDHDEWVLRHVLFAAMRCDFYPPRRFAVEEVIREVTSTSRLYKVFERC